MKSNEELRPIVEAATQGKWVSYSTSVRLPNNSGGFDIRESPNAPNNAHFIATFNPDKVIAMLDQIDALTKDNKTLVDALQKIIKMCEMESTPAVCIALESVGVKP